MQTLSKNVIADFSTQLAVKMAVGATTGTLASANDSDGVALPTGTYFLTLDKNNSKKEYIKCTLTGTALTSIQSISRQGALTSGCVREHRVGANVIISDFASLSKINDLLTGATDFDASTPLKYDGTASITTDNQFATKAYVDSVDATTDGVIATLDAQNVKLTGNQTISSGVKTFVESPIVPTPTTDMQVATKKYADDLAFAGVGDASTIAKGVVQEATQSEVNSGTTTGSTGARLYVNPSTLPSIPLLASDGSDGDVTISSGTTTLTRDMYYNNLTVNGTGTLVTAGYKIFVQGLTTVDTSGGGGGINHKGGNGGNASGVTGGTAGTIANGSQLSQAQAGKAGGNGAASAGNGGSNGTAGTTTTYNLVNSNGVAGGNGGAVGIYAGGTGGAGGTSSSGAGIATRDIVTASNLLVWTSSTAVQRPNTTAGSGSGGGGASISGTGGGGGGSGATGGHVFLATTQLAITGTGAINANGGNGGNGGNGSAGGGGGAGGNGGVVTVIYYSKTGTGTITATGGTGGAVGVGADGGTPTVGANGNNGLVIEITR